MWFWEAELASGKLFAKQMLPVFKARIKVSRFQPKGSRYVCLQLAAHVHGLFLPVAFSSFGHNLPKNDVMHSAAAH